MTRANDDGTHPGEYVRQHVIPQGVTVTKAAEILGVGRPALSNFLNGKAALSPKMALRLERAFGADREMLLDLQERFARRKEALQGEPVSAGTYAPELVSVKAREIESWAQKSDDARRELPALLRKLIHSTGRDLTHPDFPAYDNAERKGWDGVVEASTPTAWIPDGKSFWEFSCEKDPRRKANDDYTKRTKPQSFPPPPVERAECTFVFVTPHNWPGKKRWAEEKAALGDWKDVRAYDASDLEQWLEQSASTQVWFAERLGRPIDGFRSIERCWEAWAGVCDPKLSPALFDPAVEHFSKDKDFKEWLSDPPKRPFIVSAGSRAEALAFLHCLARCVNVGADRLDDRMIVFDTQEVLRRFDGQASASLIAVIHDQEVEKAIGDLPRRCHCIIVRPSNDVYAEPDVRLGLLGYKDFEKALGEMGFSSDDIERLERESARSPTILRRRLSNIPAIRTPEWAENAETARKLLPVAMVGTWNGDSPADCEVVRLLAGAGEYCEVEDSIAELLALEDPPVWSVGEYRGVASRIDTLFGIAQFITKGNLEKLLRVAANVLSESDPAIDLPEGRQWLAGTGRYRRDHSDVLRRSIRETLILLAVYGNRLFRQRLGFDAEARVATLVRKLLSPLDREKILSHNRDLPDYAEAAPEEVLSLLECDLRQPIPVVLELMRPVADRFPSSPRRTDLLWALEGLAWDPNYFPRVVEVLARLCTADRNEAHDNWVNSPENTLTSLFRSWFPQTGTSFDERVKVFKGLCSRYPTLGWSLCIGQLDYRGSSATQNHRPRWRDNATNAGRVATNGEHFGFIREVIDLVLNWQQHNERTLGDLVDRLEGFSDQDQLRIWDVIDQWADSAPSEDAKADLRERIRRHSSWRPRRDKSISHPDRERAALEKLLPEDTVTRHAWLFAPCWIEAPLDEAEDEELDYKRNEQRLGELRVKALREIWEERGFDGVRTLLERNESEMAPGFVGNSMAGILEERGEAAEFVKSCLRLAVAHNESPNEPRYRSCIKEFLWRFNADLTTALIGEIESSCESEALLTLFLCLPFRAATWRRLDDRPTSFQKAYWQQVESRIIDNLQEEEINEAIDRFLEVDRAPAAFRKGCVAWEKVETSRLIRLLSALLAADSEAFWRDQMTPYYISKAFASLNRRPGVTIEEKARLEFHYLPVLDRSEYGIPNLEEQIATSPELYAEAIAYLYKREEDGKEDPPDFRPGDLDQQQELATRFHDLLARVRRIPGSDEDGNINVEDLKKWLTRARALCEQFGRTVMGDQMIGQFLVRAPAGDDGVWPCQPVCEALECMASEHVGRGFEVGTWNSRGVYSKALDEGGNQERDLAARYRSWAKKLAYEYPYVNGLLERIAAHYDSQAGREDTRADIRQRLPYM